MTGIAYLAPERRTTLGSVRPLIPSGVGGRWPTPPPSARPADDLARQTSRVVLGNDEIEVACDAIWFVKSRGAADDVQERLWDRLQTVRTGDSGGLAWIGLTADEIFATLRAVRYIADELPLDDDEQALLVRLEAF